MSSIKLEHLYDPEPAAIAETVYGFLTQLAGPTVVHMTGRDTSRCRVVVTLLHGNEPSGLKALHSLLLSGFIPQVNTKFIVASVVAARTEPVFTHRMLPTQLDLNRCFISPCKDLQCMLANAIIEQIKTFSPEAVIDLHNTSGSGPAFSVSVHHTLKHAALASHFTHRLIYTDISLGSIMEQDFGCPIVTIEAGGSQDDEADVTAITGITSYLSEDNVFVAKQNIEQLNQPRRLEMKPGSRVAYASSPIEEVDLTMRQDIEKLNFGVTQANQALGYLKWANLDCLQLDLSHSRVDEYFTVENMQLITKCPLTLFMVTTRADIAQSDCLFYFVPATK